MDTILMILCYISMIVVYLSGMYFLDRKFYESSPRNFLMSFLYYVFGWFFRIVLIVKFSYKIVSDFIKNRVLKLIKLI